MMDEELEQGPTSNIALSQSTQKHLFIYPIYYKCSFKTILFSVLALLSQEMKPFRYSIEYSMFSRLRVLQFSPCFPKKIIPLQQ